MKKKKILIFGTGGHAKVVLSEIIKLDKYNVAGFIDEKLPINRIINKELNIRVIGRIKDLHKIIDNNTCGIIAVGTNYIRKKIVKDVKFIINKFNWAKIISKDAIISSDVKIGAGSVIVSGVVINASTIIGKHCIINTNSSIDHDNKFNNYSSCGPGVNTGGNVKIGKLSYLGIGCTINNSIIIGDNTIIGAQSFVEKNCENNSVYYGIPAKKIKIRKISDKYY